MPAVYVYVDVVDYVTFICL